eukprot:7384376-Prymnesium_polylepis.1
MRLHVAARGRPASAAYRCEARRPPVARRSASPRARPHAAHSAEGRWSQGQPSVAIGSAHLAPRIATCATYRHVHSALPLALDATVAVRRAMHRR